MGLDPIFKMGLDPFQNRIRTHVETPCKMGQDPFPRSTGIEVQHMKDIEANTRYFWGTARWWPVQKNKIKDIQELLRRTESPEASQEKRRLVERLYLDSRLGSK